MVLFFKNSHTCQQAKTVENIQDLKVNIEHYLEDFEIFEGKTLPDDLTGGKVYILPVDETKTLASQIACGRKYGKLRICNDKIVRKIFNGQEVKIKNSQCQGSFKCVNKKCPFIKRFNVMNQVHILNYFMLSFCSKNFHL